MIIVEINQTMTEERSHSKIPTSSQTFHFKKKILEKKLENVYNFTICAICIGYCSGMDQGMSTQSTFRCYRGNHENPV